MGLRYFGEPWDAPAIDEGYQVNTPVGESCIHCEEPILAGERGFIQTVVALDPKDRSPRAYDRPTHRECMIRTMFGSVEHLEGRCMCASGEIGDVYEVGSFRDQARQTMEWLDAHRRHVVL